MQEHFKYRILYIEDDQIDQMIFRQFADKKKYEYVIAPSVKEAIVEFKKAPFDIIITDWKLSDGDAFNVIEALGETVPVIFLTGMEDSSLAVRAIKAGASDYLIKDKDRLFVNIIEVSIIKAIDSFKTKTSVRESELRYKDLLDNSNDLIQIVSTKGKFLYVNQKWLTILGYNCKEISNLHWKDIIHPDNEEECSEIFDRVIEGEAYNDLHLDLISKNGAKILVEGSITTRFDETGQPISTRGIFKDITESIITNQKLHESEENYRVLVESAADIIYRATASGIITYINGAATKMAGYDTSEVIGKHFSEFIAPEFRESVKEFYKYQLRHRIKKTYLEFPIIGKNNDRIWVGQNMSLIVKKSDNNRVVRFSSVVRNITQTKNDEKRIKEQNLILEQQNKEIAAKNEEITKKNKALSEAQTQIFEANEELKSINNSLEELVQQRTAKLLQLNKELDTFIYRTSHDLKGPLARFTGLINIARYDVTDKVSREYFHKLEHNVLQLDRILNKLMMINIVNETDGKSELVNINTLLFDIQAKLGRYIPLDKIEFNTSIAGDSEVISNRDKLKIIFENLLENSVFYSLLTIHKTPTVEINIHREKDDLSINLIDNGLGIPKASLPYVFDMFYRGNEFSSGSGLGLYLVKKAVESLHGTITITSDANSYTQVNVLLPVNKKQYQLHQ